LQNRQDILDIYNEEIKLCEVSGQGEGVCDKQRLDKMYKDQIDAVTKEEEKFRHREELLKTTFNQDCYLTPLQNDYEKKEKKTNLHKLINHYCQPNHIVYARKD